MLATHHGRVNRFDYFGSIMVFRRGLHQRRQLHRTGALVAEADWRAAREQARVHLRFRLLPFVPIQSALADDIEVPYKQNRNEKAHLAQQKKTERPLLVNERYRPGIEE